MSHMSADDDAGFGKLRSPLTVRRFVFNKVALQPLVVVT